MNQITKEKIMENKPRLELRPKRKHDADRALELMRAVLRNEEQWMTVPIEWLAELRAILGDQIEGL